MIIRHNPDIYPYIYYNLLTYIIFLLEYRIKTKLNVNI